MPWDVTFHDGFADEAKGFSAEVREEIAARAKLLQECGPLLQRPHCDTLSGSKHANMKELRFTVADGVWRIAFAFDPVQRAILLVGGSKTGVSQRLFYRRLIRVADERYDGHLAALRAERKGK